MSRVEQGKYTVIQNNGSIEIRVYDPMIVAEVDVQDERKAAIYQGFRMIADYIFGNNLASHKIAMTAPVTQQASGDHHWKVQFIMPYTYSLDTLPKPKNPAVQLKQIQAKRFAVIRFSGIANQKRLEKEGKKLREWISQHHLSEFGNPIYAFFNPPWTLPFFRRNEIMIEIKKEG